MLKTNRSSGGNNINIAEEMQIRIAEKVRADSQNLTRLTSADTANLLLVDLEADNVAVNLTDMQKDKRYQDIKSVVASTGTVYLYSETYITESQAGILAQTEDIKTRVAGKVREDSQNLAKVTAIDSFGTADPVLEIGKVKVSLADMEKDDRYQDIKSVVASTGAVYLFSETYITNNYADILVRAEVNDPCATIAATVRDESRIYPRPTAIEYFNNPIFNINPEELEEHLTDTLERPDFKDIKLINASTGARYLYSNLYMNDDYARSLVEWVEVGEEENP
ncbi:hypothetical protein ACFLX0_00685 [Chloroflexota bacterium]